MNKRLLLLTLLVLLLSFSFASAALDDAEVYYTIDNSNISGATVYDISGNNDDTTNVGATLGVQGVLYEAGAFSSSDYFNLNSNTWPTTLNGDYSIGFWYNNSNTGSGSQYILEGRGDYDIRIISNNPSGGVVSLYHNADSVSTGSLNQNQYYFIVVTYSSSNGIRIYVDGSLADSDGTATTAASAGGQPNSRIGLRSDGNQPTEGTIDEFFMYSRELSSSEVSQLYNGGTGLNPYAPLSAYTTNVTNIYLSPNTSVYTDESHLRGYVTLNETTGVSGINYTYTVNGADITTVQYNGSPTGSTYTLPVFSNTNFAQNDNITVKAFAVNSTGAQLSEERTSGIVTITNRVPTGSLTWSTLNPLNDTNFTGYVTPGDSDLDTINISWTLYKNGAVSTSGSSNNNAYPYGTIALFTVDSATTNVNDTYTFNVSIYDGFDYYVSGASANATVTASENFTVTLNDEWSGIPITDYNISVGLFDSFNVCSNSSGIGSCQTMNESYFNNSYSIVRGVTGLSGSTVFSVYNYDTSTYNGISISTGLPATPYINFLGTNYSYYSSSSSTVGSTTTAYYYFNVTKTFVSNTTTYITNIISNSTTSVTLSANNYFPRTYSNWNLSENLAAELHQSEYSFNTYYLITGNVVTSPIYTISGQSYDQFNLSAGPYTVTASKAGVVYNTTLNFNATALAIETLNITGFYDQIINITAIDYVTNSSINSFNVTITYGSYSEDYETSSGYAQIPAIKGLEYTISISVPGVYASDSTTINSSSDVASYEFTLYPYNSVNILIYDYDSLSLIDNETITIEIIGSNYSVVNSTTTGTFLYSFLAPFDYELVFTAANRSITRKYVTLTADSTQEISVYMRSNASLELLELLVTDGANNELEGAIVWLQKRKTNSTTLWVTVQEAETDSDGETAVYVQKGIDHYYRFAVIYEGEAKPILPNNNIYTSPTFFIPGVDDVRQLKIDLTTNGITSIVSQNSFYGNVTLQSDNRTFVYDFIDGANSISGGILRIYGQYLNDNATLGLIAEYSLSGTSGTLNYTVPNINNTYWEARGYVYYSSGREQLVDVAFVSIALDLLPGKDAGLLYAAVFIIVVALLTVTAGPLVSSVLSFLSLVALNLFGLVSIPLTIITSMIAIVILLFFKPKKNYPGENS